MSVQTDSRPSLGTGCGLSRDWVARKWTRPIAAAVNLPPGSIAGALLTDTNDSPVIYPFVADGTMRALGFVVGGFDNTAGAQDAREVDVLSQTGHIPDKHAGGAGAILQTDIYAPAYGPDNGSVSKLSADGPCIGMLLGIDPVTAEPIALVDPVIAAIMTRASSSGGDAVTAVKTSAYSAQFGDLVQYDTTGGAFAVTLPAVAAWNKGWKIKLKNHTSALTALTVTPAGSDTIDGAGSLTLNLAKEAVTLTSDGAGNWIVF